MLFFWYICLACSLMSVSAHTYLVSEKSLWTPYIKQHLPIILYHLSLHCLLNTYYRKDLCVWCLSLSRNCLMREDRSALFTRPAQPLDQLLHVGGVHKYLLNWKTALFWWPRADFSLRWDPPLVLHKKQDVSFLDSLSEAIHGGSGTMMWCPKD